MLRVTVLSGETAHPRVMLAALTETLVRHPVVRHDRRITVSMREEGRELLPDAEETKAELLASNLAAEYALEKAMQDPEHIREEMELAVLAEETFCGRVGFSCPPPELFPDDAPETDALLLVVSPGAPMLVYPYVFRMLEEDRNLPACLALLCDKQPAPDADPAAALQRIAPALAESMAGMNRTVRFYHPSGFLPDGTICMPESASPYGLQEIFWDLLRFTARRRRDLLNGRIQELREIIMHRNSVFQSGSHRRRLELSQCRAAYAEAVRALYEAQSLMALEAGMSLTRKE